MMQKRWTLAAAADDHWQDEAAPSPILGQVLSNRGFPAPSSARQFLHERALNEDPFAMQDMRLAVERINRAIDQREKVAVYGDYDADGVCATALMLETLRKLGADAVAHIPRRDDGYGLNADALESLAREGVKLVVTVDCGIRSLAEVDAGKAAGLDIIISDHHSVGAQLPAALAVINPRRADCPGEERLAGVGVAFMLAWALLQDRWQTDRANYPAGMRLSDLLDLVALGTVADVMPLNVGLNRRVVAHGLEVINEGRRLGMAALAEVSRLKPGEIVAGDLAFRLGPRINAAGRLGSAQAALALLTADSPHAAREHALQLHELNQERQALTSGAQQIAAAQIAEQADDTAQACGKVAAILIRHDRRLGRLSARISADCRQMRREYRRNASAVQREINNVAGGTRQWRLLQTASQWRALLDRAAAMPCHAQMDKTRRRATALALLDIKRQQQEADQPPLIFAGASEALIPHGIAGLVAGRLTEERYRPAVIVSVGERESRASCRSIPEFNITRALDACAHLLLRHGGHAQAAGFTIRNENLARLRMTLERQASAQLRGKSLAPVLRLDAQLTAADWSETLAQELALLEPTGADFAPPAFLSTNLRILLCRRVGAEGQHLKLRLEGEGARIDAIGFGMGDRAPRLPSHIDAAYHFEVNEFNGRRSLQLNLLDIRASK